MLKLNANSINSMGCKELKDYAFRSHPDCYTNPGYGSKGICSLWASKNGVAVFQTVGTSILNLDGIVQVYSFDLAVRILRLSTKKLFYNFLNFRC